MGKELDPEKIKSLITEVYEGYVSNPEDDENKKKIHELWDGYDLSTGYTFYDDATEKAINYLSFLLQAGKTEEFTKQRVMTDARRILEELKK